VVEALLAHGGCDVNHKTKKGNTAFALACGGGNSVQENKAKIQRLLLQNGVEATLIECAKAGDLVGVQQRLDEGAESNQKDGDGHTALILASWNGHLAVVEALLAHGGCDVNHKTKNGSTAFTNACGGGNSVENKAKIQRLLLQNGVEATLIACATAGDLAGVQQRLGEGADIEQESDNRTPLSAAAGGGHLAVVEALLQHGAKADGKSGGAAMRLASLEGHSDMVRLLAESGAPLELTNANGDTALSYAAREGHVEVVRALLELGAKTDGKSAENALREAKDDITKQLLLQHGVSLDCAQRQRKARVCVGVVALVALCGLVIWKFWVPLARGKLFN
jgi:serine/threonine-protein phosphatase 6 regulatory ankyrin repeat subunit B